MNLHKFFAFEHNLSPEEEPDEQMLKVKKALEEKHEKLIMMYCRLIKYVSTTYLLIPVTWEWVSGSFSKVSLHT